MPRLFCFGFGYCAAHLADALMPEGWAVAGTKRAASDIPAIHVFDGTAPMADLSALEGTTHLLLSIPPAGTGDPVLRFHAADLAALPGLEWIGYLSATSVYGDSGGGWVDEDSDPNPCAERGLNRLQAEIQWLDFGAQSGVPVQIFRLAGIYGPGRSVFDRIRAGRAQRIDAPDILFSRIHVDDIVRVLRASIAAPSGGTVYNLADDEPAVSAEIVEYGYRLLGLVPPPMVALADAGLGEMGKSFYAESRRVRNDRIKDVLGVTLKYPNYRAGLRAILNG